MVVWYYCTIFPNSHYFSRILPHIHMRIIISTIKAVVTHHTVMSEVVTHHTVISEWPFSTIVVTHTRYNQASAFRVNTYADLRYCCYTVNRMLRCLG